MHKFRHFFLDCKICLCPIQRHRYEATLFGRMGVGECSVFPAEGVIVLFLFGVVLQDDGQASRRGFSNAL